jgi:hypothetical protein
MSLAISTPQAFLYSGAAAAFFVCIAATLPFPSDTDSRKNWQKVAGALNDTGISALTLLPALSAGFLPIGDVDTATYAVLGFGTWLLGVTVGMGATDDCSPIYGTEGTLRCPKGTTFLYNVGLSLRTAGASFGVGALLAFARTKDVV